MRHSIDTGAAEESKGGFQLVPEGIYEVEILEVADKVTQNGDPMASVKMGITEGQFKGQWLFDNIVIPKPESPAFKIMGRTMHFLHCIGEPYQGRFSTDTDKWGYKKLKVKVKHKIQEKGKRAGEMVATVDSHDFVNGDAPDPDLPF